MSQSPEAALESMIANLKAKTGRAVDEWLKSAKKSGFERHGQIVAFLKKALVTKVGGFGNDVDLSPKKAYVSLRRSKQFGLIQPSTATRVDVGLNLKGVAPKGRLEASGSFNSMCTHRVRLESVKDVDAELVSWRKQAYEKA